MHFRHITGRGSRDPRIVEVRRQLRRDFGVLAPPVCLHEAHCDLMCGVWCVLREVLVVGSVPREAKETIAAAISRANACSFCVDAHSIMLAATGRAEDEPLAVWAATTGGVAPQPIDDPTSEYRGTAFAFHYINRMVTIFLGPSPLPFGGRRFRSLFANLSVYWFRSSVRREKTSGAALALLPESECPPAIDWAVGNVRDALSRFSGAIARAGEAALGDDVRERISRALHEWNGEPLPLLSEAPRFSSDRDNASATLAWLSARAPERITDAHIAEARAHGVDDRGLLATTAWGAHAAASRLAERWSG